MTMRAALAAALSFSAVPAVSSLGVHRSPVMLQSRPPSPLRRVSSLLQLQDDWLRSEAARPFSAEAIEVLFRYGPEAWLKRVNGKEKYDFDVRRVQKRWGISRPLAEQEVNWLNSDPVGYIAAQTQERQRKGPAESDLLELITAKDKALASVWAGAALLLVGAIAVRLAAYAVS